MMKIIRTLSLSLLLILSACNLFKSSANAVTGDTPVLRLTVRARNEATTFSTAGEAINFDYVLTNTGTTPLAGPALVTDAPRQVSCPDVNTVGNQDGYLDLNETITCTSSYNVSESDVSTGSVTSLATANVGGITSNQGGVTLTRAVAQATNPMTLTKTASSQTYGQVGQTITYNYTITNTGTAPLGPAQFVITDNKLAAPLNCGLPDTTIAPNQSLTCSAPYLITNADMAAGNLTNSATASGAGQTSAPATTTITNLSAAAATQTASAAQATQQLPSSNLAPGSTIQHQVAVGEWLIQIGRCYGASFEDVRNANPQIADPDFILPSMIVTIPRIGSTGRIYGPPCITFYTVQSGDTWSSIAQRYNADLVVLQRVNPVTLTAGTVIKIPLNSAGSLPAITAIPTTVTATATSSVVSQRITFNAGETTVSRVGIVNPNETVQYVLAATPGQMLTISLTGPANTEVTLGVNGPTGLALKTPDGGFTWNTAITTGGDHTINIASVAGGSSKTYTLTVSLQSPVTPATATLTPSVAATATNTPASGAP